LFPQAETGSMEQIALSAQSRPWPAAGWAGFRDSQARAANARVLKNLAAHSQLSIRTLPWRILPQIAAALNWLRIGLDRSNDLKAQGDKSVRWERRGTTGFTRDQCRMHQTK